MSDCKNRPQFRVSGQNAAKAVVVVASKTITFGTALSKNRVKMGGEKRANVFCKVFQLQSVLLFHLISSRLCYYFLGPSTLYFAEKRGLAPFSLSYAAISSRVPYSLFYQIALSASWQMTSTSSTTQSRNSWGL